MLTEAVTRAGLTAGREEKMLTAIATLNACVGSCDKLLQIPIPLSYSRVRRE